MKKTILCALALNLAALPCFADVIPTRYDDDSSAAKATVSQRFQELGVTPGAADTHVRSMTSDQLAYFADDTNRIQSAGGLYWYEWILGGVVAVGSVVGLVLIAEEHRDNKSTGP